MRDISASSSSAKAVSLGPTSSDGNGQDEDIDLSDICEVVISLKCKKCNFLCNDKPTLAQHIKSVHFSSPGTGTKQSDKSSEVIAKNNGNKSVETEARNQGRNGRKSKANATTTQTSSSRQETKSKNEEYQQNSTGEENPVDEMVEDVFLCAECDIVFSSRETCCSHMHMVHGLKQFSADFIQEEIISKPNEEQNPSRRRKNRMPKKFTLDGGSVVPKKFRVTKDTFHSCTKCTIKFESVEVMKFHEKCHLLPASKMEEGNCSDDGNAMLANDLALPKGFLCPVCESNESETEQQYFPKWGPLSWHLWKAHRIDCELYTCSVCKQFKSHLSARVKDHEQLHSSKASYKCKTCNKTFKQMKQLRCHEKYHKDNSTKLAPEGDSRWYTPKECPICKRILSDSKCLKKHISAVHNKLKPYVCNICGHTSARKQELMLHVRQHTGEKPYKCPQCQFETGDHNSLRKHKLRHSDERPYACPYCDYRCIQSCAFKKHILASHPGQEVVFICQLCAHKSVNETLFAAHQKDHAEGRMTAANKNQAGESSDNAVLPSDETSTTSSKPPSNSWSGDDDSLDIIDNGGVTIPATPPPPSPISTSQKREDTSVPILKLNSGENGAKKETKTKSSSPPPLIHLMTGHTLNRSPIRTEHNSGAKQILTLETSNPTLSNNHSQIFCTTVPFSSPSLPSPSRYITAGNSFNSPPDGISQDIRTPNQTEDPESSTSEVITNPHQLIQNIQLTPLDLTDIICNEQSNDDGMLQRLLDMSGV